MLPLLQSSMSYDDATGNSRFTIFIGREISSQIEWQS
ncbi:hypothetical protein LINPERPRIM_LOCUS751 [Linum perenne]